MHSFNRAVDWRIVGRLAAGSVPAAAATLILLNYFGRDTKSVGAIITTVLGFALILTAITLLLRRWLLKQLATLLDRCSERQIGFLTIALGAALGALVSLSSVGAGAIGVTALLTLYPRMPTVRIVGSDIAHAVPLTLLAGAGHWWIGSVDWSLLFSLLIGSLPGIAIGSALAAQGARPDPPAGARRHASADRRPTGVLTRGGRRTRMAPRIPGAIGVVAQRDAFGIGVDAQLVGLNQRDRLDRRRPRPPSGR